ASAPGAVQGAVQDTAEGQLLGNDGLQGNDDHRGDERAGDGGVAVGEEERPCHRQQRADGDHGENQSDGGQRVQRAASPVPGGEAQFGPAQPAPAHQREQDHGGDRDADDVGPGGGEVGDQVGAGQHHDHHGDID